MNLEIRNGVSSIFESSGVCQSSRCRGACANMRPRCARLLAENLTIAASTTATSAIDDAASDAVQSLQNSFIGRSDTNQRLEKHEARK